MVADRPWQILSVGRAHRFWTVGNFFSSRFNFRKRRMRHDIWHMWWYINTYGSMFGLCDDKLLKQVAGTLRIRQILQLHWHTPNAQLYKQYINWVVEMASSPITNAWYGNPIRKQFEKKQSCQMPGISLSKRREVLSFSWNTWFLSTWFMVYVFFVSGVRVALHRWQVRIWRRRKTIWWCKMPRTTKCSKTLRRIASLWLGEGVEAFEVFFWFC